MITGLSWETRHNGAIGTVTGYNPARKRYFVELDSVTELNVKRENLRRLPRDAGTLHQLVLPGGMCNSSLLGHVDALALCVGSASCEPKGLAKRVLEVLPYAAPCSHRARGCADDSSATCDSTDQPGSVRVVTAPEEGGSTEIARPVVAFLHSRLAAPGAATERAESPSQLEQCLMALPSSLPCHVQSVAFSLASTRVHGESTAQRRRSELLRSFAKRNPHLKVYVVDSSGRSVESFRKEHARRNEVGCGLRRAALRQQSQQAGESQFSRMLNDALVEELEGLAVGAHPQFAAGVLAATCFSRGIEPEGTEVDADAVADDPLTTHSPLSAGPSLSTPTPSTERAGGQRSGVPSLASIAAASVASRSDSIKNDPLLDVSPYLKNVEPGSVLGSASVAESLECELRRSVRSSQRLREAVVAEREAIDSAYRKYLRERRAAPSSLHESKSASGAGPIASAFITTAQQKGEGLSSTPLVGSQGCLTAAQREKAGFDVSSADGAHVPTKLVGLKLRGPSGKLLQLPANIGDTGAATVVLGLGDYERIKTQLPGAITRVDRLFTSYEGIRGVTGTSPTLFHVHFTLDFDGVPITVKDCPVLAGHSGILLGVDIAGKGRANYSYEESYFEEGDARLPCDGFMQLRDESKLVTAQLPFVHRADTLEALQRASSSAPMVAAALAASPANEDSSAVPIAYAPSPVRVPAWSEQMVRCRIPSAAVGDHHLAVLPLEDSRIGDIGVLVAPCLQKPDSEGYVWLRVVNPSLQPVHIGALTPMARFVVHPTVTGANIKYTVDEILSKINLDPEVTPRARDLIRGMLSKRRELFSDELGYAQGMKQRIPLRPGAEPPHEQCRRLSPQEYAALKGEVDKQLKQRLIMPIVSPFSAAPMVIAKPPAADGSISHRVVLDFRRLNEITDRDSYPLPRVDDNLAKLGKAKLFTTADLLMGFHQVELEEESIPATAFSTPWGQFAYTRMPMGLTSSPSAFMRIVDATLRGLPHDIALAYCDDIIIFTDGDMEQHMKDVGAVFDKLIEGGFKVRCDKVHIGKREVPYLGFMVGAYGTRPLEKKIAPIVEMTVAAVQRSTKAAARFAGMVGVYQRFIPQCHHLLAPFHEMRVKNADATDLGRRLRFLAAFSALKHAICTLTSLSRPDMSKKFYVSVDAAATGGASAVLSQRADPDDPTTHVPLAFWSTRFLETMRGWPVRDQECFAMHAAMMEWRRYLLGAQVVVQTDHQSLKALLLGKLREGGRITDWAMDLRGFDAQIDWIAGNTNVVPDALSRAFDKPVAATAKSPSAALAVVAKASTPPPRAAGFASIARGDNTSADIVLREAGCVTFRDHKPRAEIHLQTIPTKFFRDISALSGTAGVRLVRTMVAQAIASVQSSVGASMDLTQLVLGFHEPFYTSVPYLHLHSLYPADQVRGQRRFAADVFVEPEALIARLLRPSVRAAIPVGVPPSLEEGEKIGAADDVLASRNPQGTRLPKACKRVAVIFLQKNDNEVKVLIERHGDEYVLPAVILDNSSATYREQIVHRLSKCYGETSCLLNSMQSALRMKSYPGADASTAMFVAILDNTSCGEPSEFASGLVVLKCDTSLVLSHDDDWSAITVVEDELQGRRTKEAHRARSCWRKSCLPRVKRALYAPVVAAANNHAPCTLPTLRNAPSGPAMCASKSDAAIAVAALNERLRSFPEAVLAVDLEGSLGGGKQGRRHIALLQVCMNGEEGDSQLVYVFDAHKDRSILMAKGEGTLRALLESPTVIKILHCCHGDAASLFEEYDIRMECVFDSAIADSILRDVHFNTNRGLNRVLFDYLGEGVVSLTYKSSLVHKVGMFEPRPLPEHLFVYAYEDVLFLPALYERLSLLLRRRGSTALWGAFTLGRCPPRSLEPGSRGYLRPSKLAVAITDGHEVICIHDDTSRDICLPSGPFSDEVLMGGPCAYKAAARQIWEDCVCKTRKYDSRLHIATFSQLRTPVLVQDTLLAFGFVSSCTEAVSELLAKADGAAPKGLGVLSLKAESLTSSQLGDQRALIECVAIEAVRKLGGAAAIPPPFVAEGFVAVGPKLTKTHAAVIVHDGRSAVTIVPPGDNATDRFPSEPIPIDGDGLETARNALSKYLGPALLKGGDAHEATTSSVLLPVFSKMMACASKRMSHVCTYGNTQYYSCFLPPAVSLPSADGSPSPSLECPALDIHYAAFAASRHVHNGYRQTATDKGHCVATSIRPFDAVSAALCGCSLKPTFDALALSVVREKIESGELVSGAVARAASAQHSDPDPISCPLGEDPEFDRLFEAAFLVRFSQFEASVADSTVTSCFVTEGMSRMPGDALPSRGQVRDEQRKHPGMSKFVDFFVAGELSTEYASMSTDEQAAFRVEASRYELSRDGLLMRKQTGLLGQPRIWLPPRFYSHVCRAYHDRLGHWGHAKTEHLIGERYFWGENETEMRECIREYIRQCPVCAHKAPHHKAGAGHIMPTGEHPYDILGADAYKVGRKSAGFDTIVSFMCYFSRHVAAAATEGDPTSKDIVRFLLTEVIRHYGVPSEVRSDRGSVFVSRAIRLLYAKYGIRVSMSSAYHHRTIGLVERWHQCLKTLLLSERFAVGKAASLDWPEYLPLIQLAFNATINSTTGYSPFFIIHGRRCRLPFDSVLCGKSGSVSLPGWVKSHLLTLGVVYDAVAKSLRTNALHRQKAFDLRRDVRIQYKPGDDVLLLKGSVIDQKITKKEYATEGPYLGPYTVHRVLANGNYELCDRRTRRLYDDANVERMVPYPQPRDVKEREEDRFPVRAIISRRVAQLESRDRAAGLEKGDTVLQYRIRWVGFPSTSDSWRSWHYLGDIKELVDAFERSQGREPEQMPAVSRDAAISLPPDSKALRRPHFRARPSSLTKTGHQPSSSAADNAPLVEQSITPEVAAPPATLESVTTPEALDTREHRLERRRKAREASLAMALATPYIASLTRSLQSSTITSSVYSASKPQVVELFGGCGGLALASRQEGLQHAIIVDNNARCVATLHKNGFDTAVTRSVQEMDWSPYEGTTLLTAGPPCQPWSIGGVDTGESDSRNLWLETVRAIREARPRFFLIEMVAGFLRDIYQTFRESLVSDLRSLGYTVDVVPVNAFEVSLPQDRKRCFFLGHRSSTTLCSPDTRHLVTLRDAFRDLGEPNGQNRHQIEGSAREYPGHVANNIDTLSRTLRSGGNGPGGGSNTLRCADGSIRYFTIREMARIQGFPDDFQFDPVWSHAMGELGNACPPPLARAWLRQLLLCT